MLGEVMELVAGRRFPQRGAELRGYQRRLLRGEVYPAIAPTRAARVAGVLWEGLDRAALARIDRFEGALYERRQQEVLLASGERPLAHLYVLRAEQHARLSQLDWDEAEFRARHLGDFLAACRAFAREQADTRRAR